MQEREISKWVWAMSLPERMHWMMTAVDPGDIVRAVEPHRRGGWSAWLVMCRTCFLGSIFTPRRILTLLGQCI